MSFNIVYVSFAKDEGVQCRMIEISVFVNFCTDIHRVHSLSPRPSAHHTASCS